MTITSLSAQPTLFDRAEMFSYDTLSCLPLNLDATVRWASDRYFTYKSETLPETASGTANALGSPSPGATTTPGSPSPGANATSATANPHETPISTWWLVDTRTWSRRPFSDRESAEKTADSLACLQPPCKAVTDPSKGRDWRKNYSADSLYYMSACRNDLYLYRSVRDSLGRVDPLAEPTDSIRLSTNGHHFASFAVSGNTERGSSRRRTGAIGRWVGNSHCFIAIREDKSSLRTLTLVDNLAQPRPTARSYKYAMPGETRIVKYDVYIADADSAKLYEIDFNHFQDGKILLPRFYNYPHTDRYVYLVQTNRTLDTLQLCRIDVVEKTVKALITEQCKPHYNETLFDFHILNDGKDILWWSERTGRGRYYLYDSEGRLKGPVTSDKTVAGKIVRIDTLARTLIYEGYGQGSNPCYKFYYKATFKGRNTLLTPGDGDHTVRFSPGGKYIVDTYSRMDLAPRHRICDLNGKVRFEMEPCDLSLLYRRGWKEPEVVEFLAADSLTKLYGVVYLPFGIDPDRKYPIISNVYPGPMTDLVPLSFTVDDNYNQSLAQLGFIVVNVSYRGSNPYRGRDFYTYGYGNLRDYALDDDYAVIRQTARKYPFADTTRVGIYGHSGGGFMAATAMMTRPDFYKVGVAASGNYDNNIYSQWWGETYHGVTRTTAPDGTTLFECRIPTTMELAPNLKGRLLLVTGDSDNNVHPANTMRLAKALIDNGKRFDMMILPGADHQVWNKYFINLVRSYFTEHLLGEKPESIDISNRK